MPCPFRVPNSPTPICDYVRITRVDNGPKIEEYHTGPGTRIKITEQLFEIHECERKRQVTSEGASADSSRLFEKLHMRKLLYHRTEEEDHPIQHMQMLRRKESSIVARDWEIVRRISWIVVQPGQLDLEIAIE